LYFLFLNFFFFALFLDFLSFFPIRPHLVWPSLTCLEVAIIACPKPPLFTGAAPSCSCFFRYARHSARLKWGDCRANFKELLQLASLF
jgi:hypothetical protein